MKNKRESRIYPPKRRVKFNLTTREEYNEFISTFHEDYFKGRRLSIIRQADSSVRCRLIVDKCEYLTGLNFTDEGISATKIIKFIADEAQGS